MELTDLEIKIVKILTPLIENPNVQMNMETPIHAAARMRHTKVVIFLASLTGNPNAPLLQINVKILQFI